MHSTSKTFQNPTTMTQTAVFPTELLFNYCYKAFASQQCSRVGSVSAFCGLSSWKRCCLSGKSLNCSRVRGAKSIYLYLPCSWPTPYVGHFPALWSIHAGKVPLILQPTKESMSWEKRFLSTVQIWWRKKKHTWNAVCGSSQCLMFVSSAKPIKSRWSSSRLSMTAASCVPCCFVLHHQRML